MAPRKHSVCWKLFTLNEDGKSAVCNICGTEVTHSRHGNMLRHLRSKHPVEFAQIDKSQTKAIFKPPTQVPKSLPNTDHCSGQLTIQSPLKRINNCNVRSMRKQELDACVLNLVIIDMQPLTVVENSALRCLINKLDPQYQIVSRKTLTNQMLPTKYSKEEARLKSMIKEAEHVSISTDCWTSQALESFMTVTIHFISKDWHLHSRVLSTVALQGTDTAEQFLAMLQEVFAKWGVTDKVTSVVTECVTDNSANIVSAVEKLKLRHQPCFAHTLNLVVKDAIDETYDLVTALDRLKVIVRFVCSSTLAIDHLKDAHKNLGTSFQKLKEGVDTRWNSTYEMIESYLDQHDQVTIALYLSGEEQMCISTDELEILKDALTILEPFYEATSELSGELHTTVAKIIPLVNILMKMVSSDNSPLSARLHQQLHNRFKTIDTSPDLLMATLLDPRYKRKAFPNTDFLDRAINELKEVAGSIILPECSVIKEDAEATPAKKPSLLWASFEDEVKKNQQNTGNRMTPVEVIEDEIRQHLEKPNISRDSNPLEYWRDDCVSFPNLAPIAKNVLSIPATSVPSGRLFSKAGELISQRRSQIKAKHVDMILFLNSLGNKKND